MSNYVSTLGSNINILLICTTDMTIGGQTYAANQPFTYLKNVMASVSSQTAMPQASNLSPSNPGLHLVDSTQFLNQLVISNVPYTQKVKSLFFSPVAGQVLENYDWMQVSACESKLRGIPSNIFVYKDGALLTNEQYTIEGQWLKIRQEDYDTDATFLAGYSYPDENLSAFRSENYPYFKAVLYIKGNVANKTSDQTIIFEKVSLIPQTTLDFLPNSQNFVTLNFGIIDAAKTVRLKI